VTLATALTASGIVESAIRIGPAHLLRWFNFRIKPEILRRGMIASSVKYLLFNLTSRAPSLSAPALRNEIGDVICISVPGSLGLVPAIRVPALCHVAAIRRSFTSLEVDAMQLNTTDSRSHTSQVFRDASRVVMNSKPRRIACCFSLRFNGIKISRFGKELKATSGLGLLRTTRNALVF